MKHCFRCDSKRYVVSKREDDLLAVEKCDECSRFNGVQSDGDAAVLATLDGIDCTDLSLLY